MFRYPWSVRKRVPFGIIFTSHVLDNLWSLKGNLSKSKYNFEKKMFLLAGIYRLFISLSSFEDSIDFTCCNNNSRNSLF